MTTLLTIRQAAGRLQKTYDWFLRNRATLAEKHGFPAEVAGIRHRYDPEAIDAWLRRQREPAIAISSSAPADDLDTWRAELDRRTRILAGHSQGSRA